MNIGDVVWLKSGGPAMTVTSELVLAPTTVNCSWFDDSDIHHSAQFPKDALTQTPKQPDYTA